MKKTTIISLAGNAASLLLALLLALPAMAGRITGKVAGTGKEPVAGATVATKGSHLAAVTDSAGHFTIDWPKDTATLIVSCVGYITREYAVRASHPTVIIILDASRDTLADVEVVSTGYQDIPRERSSGSFVKVDNATLNQQVGTNILKRLDGVTSGLIFNTGKTNSNPQNTTNISIRGLSTISGPLDPLIVLDGFIYEGNISNINPNDIANVTVLKDAAAASIWGARAGNGVIVINTRKARFGQKAQVNVSANVIVTEKPDLYSLPVMSSTDYVNVEEYLFNKGYFDRAASNPSSPLTPAVEIFLQRRRGLINAQDSAIMSDVLRRTDGRDQYLEHFYRKAVTQQYAVSVRGGGERNTYLFSAACDNVLGETYASDKKLNLRMENSFRPIKDLQVDASLYYTDARSGNGRNVTYGGVLPAGRTVTYTRFADGDGNPLPVATSLRGSYTDTAGGGLLLDWRYYPLEDYKYMEARSELRELFARLAIKHRPARWLDIDLGYQYQRQQKDDRTVSGAESFMARSLVNNYSQINRAAGTVTRIVPAGGIREDATGGTGSHTLRGQASAHLDGRDHSVSAILGAEAREAGSSYSRHTLYGYQADPLAFRPVDFVTRYPTYVTGSTSSISGAPYSSGTKTGRFVSLYGNASYTFRKRYTLTASMRRDGSNIFGVTTNDRWKPLWSAGAVWKLSSERFYHVGFLPSLTLRASYGHSGNVDLSRTAEAIGVYYPAAAVSGLPFTRVQDLNNPSLRWEQSAIFNIGADFSFRGGRLSGTLEYYTKKGTDLYGSAPYDYTGWGRSSILVRNVASMKGHGADLTLSGQNLVGTFSWNTTLLLSYNSSRTTAYDDPAALNAASIIGGGGKISPQVGKPLYAIVAYRWGGLDSLGNPQGYVGGVKSINYRAIANEAREKGEKGNIIYVGPSSPTWFGSLINTFTYRRLSLTANISFRAGYWFRKSSIGYASLVSSGAGHSDFSRRWQQPGDENITNVPSFIYPAVENRDAFYRNSEINALNGGHARLQYVSLSYRLEGGKFPGKDRQVDVYVNLANIGIIWRANKDGLDPDYPSSVSPQRTFAAGARANF